MKIRPLGDRIVVRRDDSPEKTAGGIVLPDTAKNKPQKGRVLAAGPGRLLKDGTRAALSRSKRATRFCSRPGRVMNSRRGAARPFFLCMKRMCWLWWVNSACWP